MSVCMYVCLSVSECPDGYYGMNCELSCNCLSDSEACSKSTGSCVSGCKAGYGGDGCQIGKQALDCIVGLSVHFNVFIFSLKNDTIISAVHFATI
jgi:hypothetical protein